MKRLLVAFLLSIIHYQLSTINAWAVEVTFGGEVRLRGFYTNNLSDAHSDDEDVCPGSDGVLDESCDDQEAFNDARFRLRMTAAEGIATGVAVVDFLSQEGRSVSAFTRSPGEEVQTGNWRMGGEGFGGSLETLFLREAYLHASFSWLNLVLGRQTIRLGHSLILDDTADALVLAIPAGPVSLTFGDLRLIEADGDATSFKADADAYFSHLAWALPSGTVTSLFAVYLRDPGPGLVFNGFCKDPLAAPPAQQSCVLSDLGDDQMKLYIVGWTLDRQSGLFRIELEADLLRGLLSTNKATALNPAGEDIKLRGVNGLAGMSLIWTNLQLGLTGVYASGQPSEDLGEELNVNALSPNFVFGNILVNNETRSDRDGGNIGGLIAIKLTVGGPVLKKLNGEAAVLWARLTEKPSPGAEQDLGWEFDLNTSYPFDDHLNWTTGLGILMTGEGWQGIYGDPDATNNQIKLSTKLIYSF
jgi:hypothetical protein